MRAHAHGPTRDPEEEKGIESRRKCLRNISVDWCINRERPVYLHLHETLH
jgi:hypothetical protein